MNVVITGGAGFIGSHLAEALLAGGDTVTAIDDLSTGSLKNLEHLRPNPNFDLVVESITNEGVLDHVVSSADAIYHLAAAVGVRLIVERPVRTIETNILGTDAVLKAAARYGTRVFIASSSEVYGKSERMPFAEDADMVLGPTTHSRWCYSCSKAIDEFLALAYHRQRGLPVVIGRLFNTVGPRQTGQYGMVVPRFVEQALAGEPITVYGDGEQARCFCHVRDVIPAVAALTSEPKAEGGIFNIGSTDCITINALAERVKTVTASRSEIVHIPYAQAYEAGFEDMRVRVPDISRVTSLIGFRVTRDIGQIIQDVARYFKSAKQ